MGGKALAAPLRRRCSCSSGAPVVVATPSPIPDPFRKLVERQRPPFPAKPLRAVELELTLACSGSGAVLLEREKRTGQREKKRKGESIGW